MMTKGSVLGWFDRGNQRAMDYVRSQPDSGLKIAPYAKSDASRRTAIAIVVVVGLMAAIDWRGGIVALVVAAPLLWRLEHHFFFGRHDAESEVKSHENDSGS